VVLFPLHVCVCACADVCACTCAAPQRLYDLGAAHTLLAAILQYTDDPVVVQKGCQLLLALVSTPAPVPRFRAALVALGVVEAMHQVLDASIGRSARVRCAGVSVCACMSDYL
jgi:hypothetical protein